MKELLSRTLELRKERATAWFYTAVVLRMVFVGFLCFKGRFQRIKTMNLRQRPRVHSHIHFLAFTGKSLLDSCWATSSVIT